MTEPHGTDDSQRGLFVPCIQRPFKGGTQVVLLGDYPGLLFAWSCWGWMTLGEILFDRMKLPVVKKTATATFYRRR